MCFPSIFWQNEDKKYLGARKKYRDLGSFHTKLTLIQTLIGKLQFLSKIFLFSVIFLRQILLCYDTIFVFYIQNIFKMHKIKI